MTVRVADMFALFDNLVTTGLECAEAAKQRKAVEQPNEQRRLRRAFCADGVSLATKAICLKRVAVRRGGIGF